ncbi:MAG: hypothetical protein ACYDBB_09430 [Armatimonadota bacterium]
MKPTRYLGIVLLVTLVTGMLGCSSGGSDQQYMTPDEFAARGQQELESVTTNLTMQSNYARQALKAAQQDFATAVTDDPAHVKGKMGYALATTFIGFYDLIDVLPSWLDTKAVKIITDFPQRDARTGSILDVPAMMAQGALASKSRSSQVQTSQMLVISRSIPALRQAIPLFDEVETAVRNGSVITLKVYMGGQIRTVAFGVADIQLVAAFANYIEALLNLSVAFNLDIPNGSPMVSLPIDANASGTFEAAEYLIASPFLDKLHPQGVSGFLQYLRAAAGEAKLGAGLSGHTSGSQALVDTTDPAIQQALLELQQQAAVLETACTAPVQTDVFFGDGIIRTINLPQLVNLTTFRNLMPSFQANDLDDPGIWPDPTFTGTFTPGIPQDYWQFEYDQLEGGWM